MTGRRPVLVTGSHRSGTTWVGRMLAAAEDLHYVQEPFNIVAHQRWLSPRPSHQFLYIDDANERPWVAPMQRVIDLRYPLLDHIRHRTALPASRMVKIAVEASRARRRGASALIKDPIAIFSTPWLARRFDVVPVILVRDPVSFVGSLKERNWAFDFHHWLRQPSLISDVLGRHESKIIEMIDHPGDIVDQGILQWNAFYGFVDDLRTTSPEFIVVRYEHLASNPLVEVEALYRRLGLQYGPAQHATILTLTSERTITSARGTPGGEAAGASAIDVHRDSRAALTTWRDRLTPSEIDRIRAGTADLADRLGATSATEPTD